MKSFARSALTMASALLAGCGGSQQPLGSPGPQRAVPRQATPHVRTASSSSGDLLYVASRTDGIFVLTYPQGALVTNFKPPHGEPRGLCSDSSGDVFVPVASNSSGHILEYAHGGTSPIATLHIKYVPQRCAVDPVTGNLAVTNAGASYNEGSSLAIYHAAQGKATYDNNPKMTLFRYCAYDTHGNLFVDGWDNGNGPYLTELPYGTSAFTDISLPKKLNKPFPTIGPLQWVGSYLAISLPNDVYHLVISGSTGTIDHRTRAKGMGWPWVIYGKTLITTYGHGYINRPDEVAYWNYPRGGTPTQVLNEFGVDSELDGVTISFGSSR